MGCWSVRYGLVAVIATLMLGGAAAEPRCGEADARGIRACRAGLQADRVAGMAAAQEMSQWCWAASITMVFAHHGLRLSQSELVREHLGEAADRRVGGEDVTRLLSRAWRAEDGAEFMAQAQVADAQVRRFGLRGASLLRELAAGRPLIMGVRGHMMVLVAVEYQHFTVEDAVRITGATVIDPAAGVRPLADGEMRPSYLAAITLLPRP